MARSTHDKQLERARAKRRRSALDRRRGRSKLLVYVLVGLLVLSLVGVALSNLVGDDEVPAVDDVPADDPAATPDDDPQAGDAADLERPEGACPPTPDDVPEPAGTSYDAPPELTIDESATYTATIATTCGDIVVQLDAAGAPVTTNNFVTLAEDGYFDGVGFHRVIDGFMAQGGDPTGTGSGGPGYTFEDELEPAEALIEETGVYPAGTLAMANSGPDTNGSQFFIVQTDYPLPPDYTVFGEVLEGQDVVDAIVLGPVQGDLAIDPVRITSVTVETA